jgi:hypothetical protein
VNQFATFFPAPIDEATMRLTSSNAGQFPVVFRRGGEQRMLVRGGTVVGILEDAQFERDLGLRPGDRGALHGRHSEAANAEASVRRGAAVLADRGSPARAQRA